MAREVAAEMKEIANDSKVNVNTASDGLLLNLPSHTHDGVEVVLRYTERALRGLHHHSMQQEETAPSTMGESELTGGGHETIFANSYTDLGKIDIVGFDYDYTLLTYKEELLDLI